MQLRYRNKTVEKLCTDYKKAKKELPFLPLASKRFLRTMIPLMMMQTHLMMMRTHLVMRRSRLLVAFV